MSSKPKRIRASNFSAEEKEITLAFVQEHSVVLESKAADPNIKKKRGLREELAEKMRKAGYLRSPSKLRDFRRKQAAKTSITRFKKEQRKMEGGPGSLERETPLIWIGQFIMFAPIDFEKDVSAFDSDYFRVSFFFFFFISLDIHKVVILPFFYRIY
jgi:hypothetical protein